MVSYSISLNKLINKAMGLNSINLKIMIHVSLFLNVILATLVFTICYSIHQDVSYNLPLLTKTRLENLEVFCEDMSLSPEEDKETYRPGTNCSISVDSAGKYVCESKNIRALSEKVIERKLRVRHAEGDESTPYLSCGKKSLAPKSGHLTTTFSQISRDESLYGNDTETVLYWVNENTTGIDAGHSVNTYHKSEITVQTGQTYVVYASVHVNISRTSRKDEENRYRRRTFTLKVCKKRYGYEQIVLGETKRFPIDFEDDVVSSVKVMGHLQLRKNESVYVKVSNVNYVIPVSTGNTFGLFPL